MIGQQPLLRQGLFRYSNRCTKSLPLVAGEGFGAASPLTDYPQFPVKGESKGKLVKKGGVGMLLEKIEHYIRYARYQK